MFEEGGKRTLVAEHLQEAVCIEVISDANLHTSSVADAR